MKLWLAKHILSLALILVGWLGYHTLGAFTTLNSTDRQVDFPTTYNANITRTIEIGTTSVASITTLSGLVSVGTITTGTWQGTLVGAAYGGTASSTTGQANKIVLANGTNGFNLVGDWGTSGQLLTSNGANVAPTWSSPSVDLTINYNWTGYHTFSREVNFNGTSTQITQLSIGTSTPSLLTGLTVGTTTNFTQGVGVGRATTTGNPNIEVAGTLIAQSFTVYGTASTSAYLLSYTSTTTANGGCSGSTACSRTTTCPAGTQVMGGGASPSVTGQTGAEIRESYPDTQTSWTGTTNCSGACGAYTLTVYAICAVLRK